MANETLLLQLKNMNHGISADAMFNGQFGKLLDSGLQVLTFCSAGSNTGRSKKVADTLSLSLQIPSVRFLGGLSYIHNGHVEQQSLPVLQTVINSCPFVAAILSQGEVQYYSYFLKGLNCQHFTSPDKAIADLRKQIKLD